MTVLHCSKTQSGKVGAFYTLMTSDNHEASVFLPGVIIPLIHSSVMQVDDLLVLEEQLDVDVRSLDTCQYAHSTFAEILNKIQKAVDDLSLHQYSNLHIWVQRLDEQVGILWFIITSNFMCLNWSIMMFITSERHFQDNSFMM